MKVMGICRNQRRWLGAVAITLPTAICIMSVGASNASPASVHVSVIIPPIDSGVGSVTVAASTVAPAKAVQKAPLPDDKSNSSPPAAPGNSQKKPAMSAVPLTPATETKPRAKVVAAAHPSEHRAGKVPSATRQDGPAYRISQFKLAYEYPRNELPSIAQLMHVPVVLGLSQSGYVAAVVDRKGKLVRRKGFPVLHTTLAAFNHTGGIRKIHLSAINSIGAQLYMFLDHHGFPDVLVARSIKQFRGLRDMRSESDTSIDLVIHDLIITKIRTVASGAYFSGKHPIDNARNQFIIRHSPLRVGPNAPATEDVFNRQEVDDYLLRLNQQPGRQVSAGLSAGDLPDSMILDYDVHQAKPWLVYSQISNTGTPQTNPWIEDFGFIDNQLTNHDDVLSLNYATAGFSKMQSVQGSYEFPILGLRRIRGRIFASYNQYNASNVGLGNLNFNGRASGGGGELIINLAQYHRLFIYGILGLQYLHESVNDISTGQAGSGDFLLPYATLRFTRRSAISNFSANATVLGQWTPTQATSLDTLGRFNTNRTWAIFQGNAYDAFYLEPLLESSAYQSGQVIPANQIYMSISGQEAFGQRLIPQEEDVIGGLYTVRGYPESIVAGDNAVYGSLEYRLHIPHLFPINSHQKTKLFGHRFDFSPPNHFTTPDWDLMLFTFLDGGVVQDSQAQPYEGSATLLSTGLGARLTLYSNMELLADWGVALHSVSPRATGQGGVSAGSSQFNFLFEVSY